LGIWILFSVIFLINYFLIQTSKHFKRTIHNGHYRRRKGKANSHTANTKIASRCSIIKQFLWHWTITRTKNKRQITNSITPPSQFVSNPLRTTSSRNTRPTLSRSILTRMIRHQRSNCATSQDLTCAHSIAHGGHFS
jgi:hypothetical protein